MQCVHACSGSGCTTDAGVGVHSECSLPSSSAAAVTYPLSAWILLDGMASCSDVLVHNSLEPDIRDVFGSSAASSAGCPFLCMLHNGHPL